MNTITAMLQHKIDTKTKPLGALGTLETLALQIGTIQNSLSPQINEPHIVVFAADHGIATTGLVNPFPQAVTAQMVLNFVGGGAAINVFCNTNDVALTVVDAGVNFEYDTNLPIVHTKIAMGTKNYLADNAMTIEQVQQCIDKAGEIVQSIFNKGCNTIGFGEMGIGNTSSASLIMHHYLQLPIADCVGRGTGVNDAQLAQKTATLESVSKHHNLQNTTYTAQEVLSRIGGFEIAMMAGAYLKAYELNMLIVVDGFITTAALLCAKAMQPMLINNCVFAHTSGEQGHQKILQHLGVTPLLNMGLRLGEGTGAALAIPLLRNACAFVNHMASFESAGVNGKEA